MKFLSVILVVLMSFTQAMAADLVIQVQPTSKSWKIINGDTVVGVLDRDSNGLTTMSNGSPYVSTLLGLKMPGTQANGPVKKFNLKTLGDGISQIGLDYKVYFSSGDCSGQGFSDSASFLYLDGIYKLGSDAVYVSQNATAVPSLAYNSTYEGSMFGCQPNSGTATDVYPLSTCTVAACGFDGSSVLKLVHK